MALKPESVEKLTKFFEIDSDEKVDEFLTQFPTKFLTKDKAHTDDDVINNVVGERMNIITSQLADVVKPFDPNLSFKDLKAMKVEGIIKLIKDKYAETINDYQTKLKDGSDKRVNDLTKQIEDKDKTISSYKESVDKLSGEYDNFRTSATDEMKKYKINIQKDSVKNKITWRTDLTDVDREGFETVLNKQFQFDLDETDNLIVKDKNGKLINNPKAGGKFLQPIDIMDEIAEANRLKQKNNAASSGKNINFDFNYKKTDAGTTDIQKGKLSPEYLERKQKANNG